MQTDTRKGIELVAAEGQKTPYVIITPVRDEEQYIEQTIRGVCHQTIRPIEWVIVDDGSADNTGAIIDCYAASYPWITCIHRANRGFRDPDIGAAGTFCEGWRAVRSTEWQFIVNLDGDLDLEPS